MNFNTRMIATAILLPEIAVLDYLIITDDGFLFIC
jgi:hypothetical protein